MSTFKVPVTEIRSIMPHTNADRLEIAKIYDWDVIVRKGDYKEGDAVVYIPVDSILPQELEDRIFGPDSKIKLDKHRVRSIRIRGQISQGMIIPAAEFNHPKFWECCVAETLGITKYEPPVKDIPSHMRVQKKKKAGNANFKQYTSIENFKYYDRTLQDGELVYFSEKLHGTSFRAGWFKTETNTFWKRIKDFFGMLPEWEFCYGSRTVEISAKPDYNGFYGYDVYGKMVRQYRLKETIPVGKAVYGEIVGDGIQKNYSYGCKSDQHLLFVYDVMDTNEMRWLDYPQFKKEVSNMNLNRVPELYIGPWNKDIAVQHRDGDSTIAGQTVREGIIIKPVVERRTGSLSRVVLKYISEAYYLKQAEVDGTEFH